MATPTSNLTPNNYFSSTLSSPISASDTTIPLNAVPSGSEGYLVIDEGTTSKEIIFYNSVGANFVTCPDVSTGRGVGGTTAVGHASGAVVKQKNNAEWWLSLQNGRSFKDATNSTGSTTGINPSAIFGNNTRIANYVEPGTGTVAQSAGLTGTFADIIYYIGGKRYVKTSIANKAYTASKDTYVDIDTTGTVTYTEVANNAASPALAANNIRVAIVVTNGSAITSVNQGSTAATAPTVSSNVLTVSDSLGNLIYPQPGQTLIGYRAITATSASTSASSTDVDIAGLDQLAVNVPTGRKIKLSAWGNFEGSSGSATLSEVKIKESSTVLQIGRNQLNGSGGWDTIAYLETELTPSAGAHTYKFSHNRAAGSGTVTPAVFSNGSIWIKAELV